jgi:hypothetical protein
MTAAPIWPANQGKATKQLGSCQMANLAGQKETGLDSKSLCFDSKVIDFDSNQNAFWKTGVTFDSP